MTNINADQHGSQTFDHHGVLERAGVNTAHTGGFGQGHGLGFGLFVIAAN